MYFIGGTCIVVIYVVTTFYCITSMQYTRYASSGWTNASKIFCERRNTVSLTGYLREN